MNKPSSRRKPARSIHPQLSARELQLAGLVRARKSVSRWEIHQITKLHPYLITTSILKLMDAGLLMEGVGAPKSGTGRPRVPLTIDGQRRNVIGLSLAPGEVRAQRVSLTGLPIGDSIIHTSTVPDRLISVASRLLNDAVTPETLSIGLSVTGFVDPDAQELLFSSVVPSKKVTSLKPIYDAAGPVPIVLDNDLHALSARWLLEQPHATQDVLLVQLDDGRLGASMLIEGKPNRGCVTAANELGHLRLAVDTDPCYCGQIGCVERIFSTAQLRRLGEPSLSLDQAIKRLPRAGAALDAVLDLLATALANGVNFMRPSLLVLASPFASIPAFNERIESAVRQRLLPGLVDRVRVEPWEHSSEEDSASAAWLALAALFGNPWNGHQSEAKRPASRS